MFGECQVICGVEIKKQGRKSGDRDIKFVRLDIVRARCSKVYLLLCCGAVNDT